jgi:hypothetical protein
MIIQADAIPAEVLSNFKDPVWRINNLYWIIDKKGKRVKFSPNAAQANFLNTLHYQNIILKARQRGFSTLIQILMLDACVFNSNTKAGVIAHNVDDARIMFRDKIKYAYDNLPSHILEEVTAVGDSATELVLSNGSNLRVGTSMRSGTLQYLHVSEFGKICAKYPEKAREVVTGAIPAVQAGNFLFIESTAEGREGYFYEMCKEAEARASQPRRLNPLEAKFHFYSWWDAEEYELNPEGVVITDKDNEYFRNIEAKIGQSLSIRKRAWYVMQRNKLGPEDMMREYPSIPEEAFMVSTEGCYYSNQLALVRSESRICTVPYVPNVPVNTFWDIGQGDETAIWFHQRIRTENRFIRYYENSGESFGHFVSKMQSYGYVFGKHFLPHDAAHKRQLGLINQSAQEMLEDLGLRDTVIVPRIPDIIVGINKTRDVFGSCLFDEVNTQEGIVHLENYRKEWDERRGCWKDTPRHDVHSNGSDAFRQFAQGYEGEVADWGGNLNYKFLGKF